MGSRRTGAHPNSRAALFAASILWTKANIRVHILSTNYLGNFLGASREKILIIAGDKHCCFSPSCAFFTHKKRTAQEYSRRRNRDTHAANAQKCENWTSMRKVIAVTDVWSPNSLRGQVISGSIS